MTRGLLVDDDVRLLRALRINLTARDYPVLTVVDGRGALSAAAASTSPSSVTSSNRTRSPRRPSTESSRSTSPGAA